jgi:hypothetical protein
VSISTHIPYAGDPIIAGGDDGLVVWVDAPDVLIGGAVIALGVELRGENAKKPITASRTTRARRR